MSEARLQPCHEVMEFGIPGSRKAESSWVGIQPLALFTFWLEGLVVVLFPVRLFVLFAHRRTTGIT